MIKPLFATAAVATATWFWWPQPDADSSPRFEFEAGLPTPAAQATAAEVRQPAGVIWQAPDDRALTPSDDFERAQQLAVRELSRIPQPPSR